MELANNVKNFFQGNLNKMRSNYGVLDLHIQEQAEYRAFLCLDCLENKKCLECKCSTPGLFYAPNKKDSKNRWGIMLHKTEWEKFKTTDSNYLNYKKQLDESNGKDIGGLLVQGQLLGEVPTDEVTVQEVVSG